MWNMEEGKVHLLIDTCVLPRCKLEEAQIYRNIFGDKIGFELLPMWDLSDFEANLQKNLPFLMDGDLMFHEPVWGVEHTAPKGTPAYEKSMQYLLLTKKYAEIMNPPMMVYHLNNRRIPPDDRDELLRTSLENLEEERELFPNVTILVENTGTDSDGNKLLDQQEFTDLCRDKHFDVLIDVGHANANSWDVYRLISDLKDQVRGFHLHNNAGRSDSHNRLTDGTLEMVRLVKFIRESVPDAFLVIEYTRPIYHGLPLLADMDFLMKLTGTDLRGSVEKHLIK